MSAAEPTDLPGITVQYDAKGQARRIYVGQQEITHLVRSLRVIHAEGLPTTYDLELRHSVPRHAAAMPRAPENVAHAGAPHNRSATEASQ